MHKVSIALAVVVFACPACLALSRAPFYLTKPNISDEQFGHDRKECAAKATTAYGGSCVSEPSYVIGPGGARETSACIPTPSGVEHDSLAFLQCMKAKGYQETLPPMPASKAGLYELRKFSNLAVLGRRDLASTLPSTQRRASAEALAQPGPVFKLCVAKDGAQQLGTVAGLSSSCTYSNIVSTPHGFVADASCPGGQLLHVTFESTTPDRREFAMTGQPAPKAVVPRIDRYQLNWIASDCGDIPPGSVRTPEGRLVTMAKPVK